jgi:hypothetical protein
LEHRLRFLAKSTLSQKIANKAVYWRQWEKLKNCVLGDDNTRYVHLCASSRLQKNKIKNFDDQDGNVVFSHLAKATILHDFFKNLLGTPIHTADNLDWAPLIASTSLTPS